MNALKRPASAFGGPEPRAAGSASECKAIACDPRAGKSAIPGGFCRESGRWLVIAMTVIPLSVVFVAGWAFLRFGSRRENL